MFGVLHLVNFIIDRVCGNHQPSIIPSNYMRWLPIRYIVCWTGKYQRNIYNQQRDNNMKNKNKTKVTQRKERKSKLGSVGRREAQGKKCTTKYSRCVAHTRVRATQRRAQARESLVQRQPRAHPIYLLPDCNYLAFAHKSKHLQPCP